MRFEQTFYDAYGRTLAYYDASEEGSLYHYNSQGYQQSIQGIRTGIVYQTIQDKNAFGHVTREVSGNVKMDSHNVKMDSHQMKVVKRALMLNFDAK